MRLYGLITTAIISVWATAEYLVYQTTMEFFHMVFITIMTGFFATAIYLCITEPRKKKARWVKSGELEVMVMGKRKERR